MKNFKLLEINIDTATIVKQIQEQPELWNADTFRTEYITSPMRAVSDILIRFPDTNKGNKNEYETYKNHHDDTTQIWHPAYYKLPAVKSLILLLMNRLNAYRVHRVLIVKNAPGTGFGRHADNNVYATLPNAFRYHLVLQGEQGNMFSCGDESASMHTGELWWFDTRLEHESMNISKKDRIHFIIDLEIFP